MRISLSPTTIDMIFTLRQLREKASEQNKPFCIAFVDFSTTKCVYMATPYEGFSACPASNRRRRYDNCAFGAFYALTIQVLSHILRLICKRYLTDFPPFLHLLNSLSMFEKLTSCINPLPGHRTQHRRSYSKVRHLTRSRDMRTQHRRSYSKVRHLTRSRDTVHSTDDLAQRYAT